MTQVERAGDVTERPFTVVSAEATLRELPELGRLHQDWTSRVSGSRHHTVVGAAHFSLVGDRAKADEVSQIIEGVVLQARR